MRRCLVQLFFLALSVAPVQAQSLRDEVSHLFEFGDCGEPLCLNVGDDHGDHYVPASERQSGQIIAFLENAIASSVTNVPIGGASGGSTFNFVGGVPVRSTVSAGPIFAERAETIGRRRILAGVNTTVYSFSSVRGTPLDNLVFNFTHENVEAAEYGSPTYENDVIQVTADLDVRVAITSLFATFGLFDGADIGLAVPLVQTSVSGSSAAQIIPFGITPHSFSATESQLTASSSMDGSSIGIGDILLRGKLGLLEDDNVRFSVLADVRLPTGSQEELLGSGSSAVRGMGIISGRYDGFSPHANAGFVYRTGEFDRSSVLATVGFDQLLTPGATAAVELISSWAMGSPTLILPPPQEFDVPYTRTLPRTNIKESDDNVVYSSIGVKVGAGSRLTIVANALVPVLRGGFQPDAAWTLGLEYNP